MTSAKTPSGNTFCRSCGVVIVDPNIGCEDCNKNPTIELSQKSYGVSIALCGVFGILGFHHFYLGNWLHGLFDLILSVVGLSLIFVSKDPNMQFLGFLMLLLDFVHTVVVMYRLFVGKCRDGDDLLVPYPNQVFK